MKEGLQLVCFDLDNTLIDDSWARLNPALGLPAEEDARLVAAYEAGEFTYEEWMQKLLEIFLQSDKATREGITDILSGYVLREGAREAVDYVRGKGYRTILISGSIDLLVDLVVKDLGIEFGKATNTFVFDEGGRLERIHTHGDEVKAKLAHLEAFSEMLGIPLSACACLGDGANDLEMFRATGHGITFRGSKIEQDAWRVIDSLYDLKGIL